ncbi:MAG: type II toxin-antitoxin system RelE/ParE family toxin [Candidatus Diapherotrites archaeon]|nr:type II toxin-antitoxin system RelE/ParE family toxin [Candidatus Diapherotrites archaeon]
MRSFSTKPTFDKQLKKLDQSTSGMVLKRMEKIMGRPELGKPLNAPMQNYFSERIGKYRVIYRFTADHVTFVYLDHRDHVFSRPFE